MVGGNRAFFFGRRLCADGFDPVALFAASDLQNRFWLYFRGGNKSRAMAGICSWDDLRVPFGSFAGRAYAGNHTVDRRQTAAGHGNWHCGCQSCALVHIVDVAFAQNVAGAAQCIPKLGGKIPLEINLGNGKKRYMALLDTGNLMTEPISGLPVVLLHEKKPLPYTATWPVPYHSLAGTGVVNACRPQSARAFIDGKWQQLDVMIATAPGGFSPGIEAILGPNALPAAGPAHRIGKRNISMFLLGRRKQ